MASFPEEIPGDDLIRAFTLTGADRDLVAIRRGAANRLGLALQLCALRYLGFVPRNLSAAPRCFGFIPSSPTWPSVLADFMAAGYNINASNSLEWISKGPGSNLEGGATRGAGQLFSNVFVSKYPPPFRFYSKSLWWRWQLLPNTTFDNNS